MPPVFPLLVLAVGVFGGCALKDGALRLGPVAVLAAMAVEV